MYNIYTFDIWMILLKSLVHHKYDVQKKVIVIERMKRGRGGEYFRILKIKAKMTRKED